MQFQNMQFQCSYIFPTQPEYLISICDLKMGRIFFVISTKNLKILEHVFYTNPHPEIASIEQELIERLVKREPELQNLSYAKQNYVLTFSQVSLIGLDKDPEFAYINKNLYIYISYEASSRTSILRLWFFNLWSYITRESLKTALIRQMRYLSESQRRKAVAMGILNYNTYESKYFQPIFQATH